MRQTCLRVYFAVSNSYIISNYVQPLMKLQNILYNADVVSFFSLLSSIFMNQRVIKEPEECSQLVSKLRE